MPTITGMLVDFESFDITDIYEMIKDKSILLTKIKEAKDIIENNE